MIININSQFLSVCLLRLFLDDGKNEGTIHELGFTQ